MRKIRVLIVDDHSIYRKGVRSILEASDEIEVVGECDDGLDAIQLAQETIPDMILMDVIMPRCNGIEATKKILSLLPSTRIVMLTISDSDDHLFEAVKSGAQGYLEKDLGADELVPLIKRASKGEALLSGLLAAKVLNEFKVAQKGNEFPVEDPLSSREIEILKLVTAGLSNRMIAEKLVISENTVKHHLSNILGKLHLRSRIQLAVYSLERGVIKDPLEPQQ